MRQRQKGHTGEELSFLLDLPHTQTYLEHVFSAKNDNWIKDVPTYTHIKRTFPGTTNARDPMVRIGLSDNNLPKEINFNSQVCS